MNKLFVLLFSFLTIILLLNTSCVAQDKIEVKYKKEYNSFEKNGIEKKINSSNFTANDIISTAKSFIGTPHCMGGSTKKCMDCSGLILRTYKTFGIDLPHNSQEQARYGKPIFNKTKLQKGDFVFFTNTYKTSAFITHSGIYLGDGTFIHTSTKIGVTITQLDTIYWKDRFVFGTRVF